MRPGVPPSYGFAVLGPEELGLDSSNASDSTVGTSRSSSALEWAQKLTIRTSPWTLVSKNVFQIDAPSLLSLKSFRKKGRPLMVTSTGPESRCMPCACRTDSPESRECLILSAGSVAPHDDLKALAVERQLGLMHGLAVSVRSHFDAIKVVSSRFRDENGEAFLLEHASQRKGITFTRRGCYLQ